MFCVVKYIQGSVGCKAKGGFDDGGGAGGGDVVGSVGYIVCFGGD